jgi:hypothetical protein
MASFFPMAVLPLPSLPWQAAQCCAHSAAGAAAKAAPEFMSITARITDVVRFIGLGSFRWVVLRHLFFLRTRHVRRLRLVLERHTDSEYIRKHKMMTTHFFGCFLTA